MNAGQLNLVERHREGYSAEDLAPKHEARSFASTLRMTIARPHAPCRRACRRRGIIMTEILMILFFLGAIALVAARLFTSEIRIIRQVEAQQDRTSHLQLVLAALRADVWSAGAAEVEDDGRLITLHEPENRTIVWRVADDAITRSTSEDDAARTWAAPFAMRAERDAAGLGLRLDEHNIAGESHVRLPSQLMLVTSATPAAGGGR
jgi:hypothetical protein